MYNLKYKFAVLCFIWFNLLNNASCWWTSKRCTPEDCKVSGWSAWSSCTTSCGFFGTKLRTRRQIAAAKCKGKSCPSTQEQTTCNLVCCPQNCKYEYTSWGPCQGCGTNGKQIRSINILKKAECNGHCNFPVKETRTCTARCCPVDCQVGTWSTWSKCDAKCDSVGKITRKRSITKSSACNGKACPKLDEQNSCNGPCCPKDCQFSTWTKWSICSAPSGLCSANSGQQKRSRVITKQSACGGNCAKKEEVTSCTPPSTLCKLSPWVSWNTCQPTNGKCGGGSQTRSRSVVVNPICSSKCDSLTDTRTCQHVCCPEDCAYSTWAKWTQCSNQCGSGITSRTRVIAKQGYCGGVTCNQTGLVESKQCSTYKNVDCKVSVWSTWSNCSTTCGTGLQERTRNITQQSSCSGTKCPMLLEKKVCSDHSAKQDCQVGDWGKWSSCTNRCDIGSRIRSREITTKKVCGGRQCPQLKNIKWCGKKNGGCDHYCDDGKCSCQPGHDLVGNATCQSKDCGLLFLGYCPPNLDSNLCAFPDVNCPGDKTQYPARCDLTCNVEYKLVGWKTVSCRSIGSWSPSLSYCKLINEPPYDILLSNSDVEENKYPGTTVGILTTLDKNINDTHQYMLVNDTCGGCFALVGSEIQTAQMFDYEQMKQTYQIRIRSTDDGSKSLSYEKVFTISIDDVNEAPTSISLSNDVIDENSDQDTFIGELQTVDEDFNQTFVYELLPTPTYSRFFKLKNNKLMVAASNDVCLSNNDPSICPLNFEKTSTFNITVIAIDNGKPPLNYGHKLSIKLRDMNDKPFDIKLSSSSVKENAPAGTFIGILSAKDEDPNQKLSFRIKNDAAADFYISNAKLYKSKPSDYEKLKEHKIEVEVADNGSPVQKITSWFTINILDVNEPPVNITLKPIADVFQDANGNLSIPENTTLSTHVAKLTVIDNDMIDKIRIDLINYSLKVEKNMIQCKNDTTLKISICTVDLLLDDKLDFERRKEFSLLVKITERSHVSYETFYVNVRDSNDPPTNIYINNAHDVNLLENVPGENIGFLTTKDEDVNQKYTYRYFFYDQDTFVITDNLLSLKPEFSVNYEFVNRFSLAVESTDNGNPPMSVNDTIIINVMDDNDPPSQVTLTNLTIKENFKVGDIVSSINIVDEDITSPNYQTHPCKVINSSHFIIVQNNLKLQKELDFETESLINLTIQVKDKTLLTKWHFVINILDVNEKPSSISLSNDKINENMATPSLIGLLSATDSDSNNNTFKFEILTNKDLFTVKNNELFAMKSFNFETMATIDVEIRVTDSEGLSYTELKIITITDVNDIISDIELSNNIVNENSGMNTLIGTVSPKDEDLKQTFQCYLTEDSDGRFELLGEKLMVAVNNRKCLQYGGHYCRLNYEEKDTRYIQILCEDDGIPMLSFNKTFTIFIKDVNDKPFNITLSAFKLKENAPIGFAIGQFDAQDEDASDKFTFNLINTDQYFFIDSNNTLRKKSNFSDFEKNAFHKVIVQVADDENPSLKSQQEFIIEIINVNEAPIEIEILSTNGQHSFPKNNPSIDENTPSNTIIGTIFSYDQDVGANLTITLDDDANQKFTIDNNVKCATSNSGNIRSTCQTYLLTNSVLNFEEKAQYSIIIRTTDQHGLYRSQKFTIEIKDQNDLPTQILLSGKTYAMVHENMKGAYIADLSTVDDDYNQFFTYQIMNDAKIFQTKQNKLYLLKDISFDYEVTKYAVVSIKSTDNGVPSKSYTQTFNISIVNINEAPVRIIVGETKIQENSPYLTKISDIKIIDPDNTGENTTQTHTCYVKGMYQTYFGINNTHGNVLQLIDDLNYESKTLYSIKISCTDSGTPALTFTTNFIYIKVLNVNEPPTEITISSNTIPENSPAQIVGTLYGRDPDRYSSFTFSLLNSSVPFSISGSSRFLRSTKQLNYEDQNNYPLLIQITDNGKPSLSYSTIINIRVKDKNEAPTDILLANNKVNENAGTGTIVGTLQTTDEDRNLFGDIQSFSYVLTHNPYGIFRLLGNELQVAIDNSSCIKYGGNHCKLNLEKQAYMNIKIKTNDNGSPSKSYEKEFKIQVLDQNDPPRNFKLSSTILPENATKGYIIGQFTVEDEDVWQDHTFSLVANDDNRFAIDRNNDLIKVKTTNYESQNVHRIFVEVTDNGMPYMKIGKEFDIYVQDINESPTNLSIVYNGSNNVYPIDQPIISENLESSAIIGTIEAIDQDTVKDLKFKLLNNEDGKFKLGDDVKCLNETTVKGNHTKCQVLLLSNSTFNYEYENSLQITIQVKDHAGLTHIKSFDVTILDANDAPTNVTIQGEVVSFVEENLKYRLIGTLESEDEDDHQGYSYQLIDDANGRFIIHTDFFNTYRLYTTGVALDYEQQDSFMIKIKTTDVGLPPKSFTNNITIMVLDVNEYPSDIIINTPSVDENCDIGTIVSILSVQDPDINQTHRCFIIANSFFDLTYKPTQSLITKTIINYENNNDITVTINCKDSGYPKRSLTKDVVIAVKDLNDPPTGISMSGGTIPENELHYFIGDFIVSDEDKVDNHTFTLVEGQKYFEIKNGKELRNIIEFDYEFHTQYRLKVQVKDTEGLSYNESFTITVEDRNDPPEAIVCTDPLTLTEKAKPGTIFGKCAVIDDEKYQTHKYKIINVYAIGYTDKVQQMVPETIFHINSITGILELANTKLDYEAYFQYTVTIQVEDSGSPTMSLTLNTTVSITNVNQPPTDIIISNDKVNENSVVDQLVGNITIIDPDNKHKKIQSHTCWISNVERTICAFKINDKDEILVARPELLDYESKTYYAVEIVCDEDEDFGFSIKKKFDIQVLNVNEAPCNISLHPSNFINEHNQVDQFIAMVNYIDPDNKHSTVNNISMSSIRTFYGGSFTLAFPYLYSTQMLDYEAQSKYFLEVTLKDNGVPQMSCTQNITIHINNLNDAPEDIILTEYIFPEDSTLGSTVALLSTVDKDQGQSHTYNLVDGAGLFQVSDKELILVNPLDYETMPTVSILIKTTDTGNPQLSFEKQVTLTITDANDAPTEIKSTITSVPENTQSRFKIVDVNIVDEDINQQYTCQCISSNKDWVEFQNENNGQISIYLLQGKSLFDYEVVTSIKLEIRCSDDAKPSLSIESSIVVPILDLNEPPNEVLISHSETAMLNENPIAQQVIGSLSCVDPDQGQTHTYELLRESKDIFDIVSGELIVKNLENFDYESPLHDSIKVYIKVTDNGSPSLSYVDDITILATDVNEPPVNISLIHGSNIISENTVPGFFIGQLFSFNPETSYQVVTYELINYQSTFKVVTTHAPAVASYLSLLKELDYDETSYYEISIKATDNGIPKLSTNGLITLNITKGDPCSLNLLNCSTNSICERNNKTSAACICTPGFESVNTKCMPIDECTPKCDYCIGKDQLKCQQSKSEPCSPCQNNGRCTDVHLKYSCKCEPGFTGNDCSIDINECTLLNPCLHNSTCIDGINNYTCICRDGYSGSTCLNEINECQNNPCFKGDCTDLINGYKCNCPPGYTGLQCQRQENVCGDNTCKQDESCQPNDVSKNQGDIYSCIPVERIITLNFPRQFASLNDNEITTWKVQLQYFLKHVVKIPLSWLQIKSKDLFESVHMTDVSIIKYDGALYSSKGDKNLFSISEKSEAKLLDTNEASTEVKFYGLYKDIVIPRNVLLYSINETCEEYYNDCTLITNQFQCGVCKVVNKFLSSDIIKKPVVSERQTDEEEKPTMFYVILVSIGCFVMLAGIVVAFIVRRKCRSYKLSRENSNSSIANQGTNMDVFAKSSRTITHEDENYIGNMNPLYGVNEPEINNAALYENSRPEDIFADSPKNKQSKKMFSNPAFGINSNEYDEFEKDKKGKKDKKGMENPLYNELDMS